MRKRLLAIFVICVLSGAAHAQCPLGGYIGLYGDEYHSQWCVTGVGFYPVEMWVWCLPLEHGMVCAEFDISYPVNVIQSTVTWHPDIQLWIPPPDEGISACYIECKWEWVWFFHQLLYVTDPTQTRVEIVEHPVSNDILFTVCEPGYPVERAWKTADLFINYEPWESECSWIAVENRSWGAIKSLAGRR